MLKNNSPTADEPDDDKSTPRISAKPSPSKNGKGNTSKTPEQLAAALLEERIRWHRADRAARDHVGLERSRTLSDILPRPRATALVDLLAEPDEDPQYRINGLWSTGGRVMFSAQRKAGKTTVVGNLVRSLADGDPFLGAADPFDQPGGLSFIVRQLEPGERVFIADLELDRRTLRRWLRDQGIQNQDRVLAESFRGQLSEFDVLDETRRDEWAMALSDWGVKVLIIDPLAPLLAVHGFSEDSNTEISKVLAAIDELAEEAGISEVLIVHHMGHHGERSRGASRLRDWPDQEWRLVREGAAKDTEPPPNAVRFFTAEGRDCGVPETQLSYDKDTRRLTVAGGGRIEHGATKYRPMVLEAVRVNPGASGRALEAAWGEVPQAAGRRALKALIAAGEVHTFKHRTTIHHVLSDDCEAPTACLAAREAGLDG